MNTFLKMKLGNVLYCTNNDIKLVRLNEVREPSIRSELGFTKLHHSSFLAIAEISSLFIVASNLLSIPLLSL